MNQTTVSPTDGKLLTLVMYGVLTVFFLPTLLTGVCVLLHRFRARRLVWVFVLNSVSVVCWPLWFILVGDALGTLF